LRHKKNQLCVTRRKADFVAAVNAYPLKRLERFLFSHAQHKRFLLPAVSTNRSSLSRKRERGEKEATAPT
jgi:hypothetical protein